MEHLPSIEPEPEVPEEPKPPPPPTTEEIFIMPEKPEKPEKPEEPKEHKAPGVAKKPKRKYNRDPEEMKQHMSRMREIAAANRAKKKAEPAMKENVPPPLTSQTPLATQTDHKASFEQFMRFYTEAEKYKADLAHRKQEATEAAAFRAQARKQNRKRKKEQPKQAPAPFGIQSREVDPYAQYFD